MPQHIPPCSDSSDIGNRRSFLQTAGVAVSTGVFAGLATETARGFAANDTLNVACLGTGNRCRRLMQSLREIPNVRIAAVCDVWDFHLEEGAKLADSRATRTKDFRQLLDRSDIDAVLIGAPDHWHVPMTVAACAAGKDVYVEKPLTHDLSEGAAVIAAQNDHKRIVQVGTQQRSMPHFQQAYEIVKSGELGRIFKVHLTWNRNQPRFRKTSQNVDPAQVDWKAFLGSAPDQPFDDYRFRQWRWFWDFGGGILTDLMVHFIDVAHWYLGVDHPLVATTIGDHVNSAGVWETPDTIQCLLKYPNEVQIYFEGTFANARNGAMLEFMGENATLYLDRGRYEIHPERNKKIEPREYVIGTGPRGADFYDKPDGEMLHLVNWVECIRSRAKPNAPAEAGVSGASAAQLANIAYRQNSVAEWGKT
ncbi:MAG: Gfo/Idh/MocA family oxidoreductase [Planctomycetaceae bacterium]|nr:Gfo/Idh/MocA family oxidoreductase [Planctomycetaceae bacterium]